jgi:hypothetical protein
VVQVTRSLIVVAHGPVSSVSGFLTGGVSTPE